MFTYTHKHWMPSPLNPAVIGALARDAREAAGLTQTQLAERIGASRFWVAAFEKGKPTAELGLALKAIHALGLSMRIARDDDAAEGSARRTQRIAAAERAGMATLTGIIARATPAHTAPSKVIGWPGSITTVITTVKPRPSDG